VGHKGRKNPALWDIMKEKSSNIFRLFSVLFHNEGKPLSLYPTKEEKKKNTTEENLLHCRI
jgi:hypothetical protein